MVTKFKLYTDKSSLNRKFSRIVLGGTTDVLNDGKSLGWWEMKDFPKNQSDDVDFYISSEYALRPDKISYKMYGREDFMWLVLQYNDIIDINEELIAGKTIRLPSYKRTLYSLANE